MTGSRGPKSKPGAVRRNKPRAGTKLKGGTTKPPHFPREIYLAATCAWWDAWVDSPQAEHFGSTDWQRLLMLAPLVEAYFVQPTAQLMSEIRQNEAKLGATAADRDRLGWKLDEPEPAATPSVPSSRSRPDPRRRA